MADVTRVTISTGGHPQFYELFKHEVLAREYAAMWRRMAVKAGVLIRIDQTKETEK